MKRTLGIALVVSFSLLLVACEDSGGGVTKLGLCKELSDAYCAKLEAMSCPEATGCAQEGRDECDNLFDTDCTATSEDIFSIRDEAIPNWIDTKESCNALTGIENSLVLLVTDMKNADCDAGSDSDGDSKTVGELCDEVLNAACEKVVSLSCAETTQADCVTALFQNGAVVLGGVTCTSATDGAVPSDATQAAADQAVNEARSATDCSAFGF